MINYTELDESTKETASVERPAGAVSVDSGALYARAFLADCWQSGTVSL